MAGRRGRAFRRGALVEVRSPEAILRTLDERGELDALPFMPEMARFCGQRFRVLARAERLCDTITDKGCASRRMADVVFLDDTRCDGAAHGGCQTLCRLYWKTAWLQPVGVNAPSGPPIARSAVDALRERVRPHVSYEVDGSGERYRCQATQMVEASTPLSRTDPVAYLRTYLSRNVSLGHFTRIMGRAVMMEALRQVDPDRDTPLRGSAQRSPVTEKLDLQPGERVRVRTSDDVRQTLTKAGANRGLSFDREMVPFCGQDFVVGARVQSLIDERTGALLEINGDTIRLDGPVCSGEHSWARWFCTRGLVPLWRECWLERVSAGDGPGTAALEGDGLS